MAFNQNVNAYRLKNNHVFLFDVIWSTWMLLHVIYHFDENEKLI